MNSLNSILLEGNLVRDPESKTLQSGTQVCDFTVASDRFYKQADSLEKEVSYFDVEAWARLGQACSQNLKKGRGVRVVGRLKQDRWTDPEGKTRSKVKIVAEHVEFKPQKQVNALAGEESEEGEAEGAGGRQEQRSARKVDVRELESVF
jgi:single-strand DNA-binding protein